MFSCLVIHSSIFSQKINPANPDLSSFNFKLDSLPVSEINIPIQIDLKPIYELAEKSVDTLFTSPNYPNGWVQETCDTRYKYSFRRSKLLLKTSGLTFNMGFTGYYKIIGSSRVCANGIVISPWTPDCRCGFNEDERKVTVSFTNTLSLLTNYKVKLSVTKNEPIPIDKCEVCFWKQDITRQILKGLNKELDASKKEIENKYGTINFKPQFQKLWNQLNNSYNIYGLGWFNINPQSVRLNRLFTKNDSLHIFVGLSAKPVISFEKQPDNNSVIPNITTNNTKPGFSIYLDAILNYDSLTYILNQQIAGKKFDFRKAFVKKTFIIDSCKIYGGGFEKLIIRLHFSGTNSGTVYLIGKPEYNSNKMEIEVKELDFDIKTRNVLLNSAGWIFDKKITKEVSKFTRFELSSYIDTAKALINQQLNQEWTKGINSTGDIKDIRLIGIYPMQKHLVIRSNCEGELMVKVDAGNFSL